MAQEGQEIQSPGGMTLRIVRITLELLEMDAAYSGEAGMPPEHLHPSQAERFEILDGSMRTIVGGEERVYETGESFEVPAGTRHQMAAQIPTRMRCHPDRVLSTYPAIRRLSARDPV
jgi:mannose-6-phosphate isomerase-like protein (cupin superfamily)